MKSHLVQSVLIAACLLLPGPPPAEAGSDWAALPNAPVIGGRHDDVFFVDPDRGWIVNGLGEVYHTTDGGDSWVQQLFQPAFYFRSVGFADPLKGWVGNLDGAPLLYATTDGGSIWTPITNIPPPQPTGICGIWVVNGSIAYACGRYDGPARVIKTTDGGATWSSSDLSPLATTLIDCFFFDENHGFVVGGIGSTFSNRRAVVLATTNGGASWQTRHTTNRSGEWCWKITFPTANIGYVSIENFGGASFLLKTTDGGQTWSDLFFLNSYEEQGIGFVNPSLGWIGGHDQATYETTDGGASWHPAGFGFNINRFRFLGQTVGYAVGETVYKYSPGTTGVIAEGTFGAPILVLSQNQPNPFMGSTSIPYVLAQDSKARVTIEDALGRNVAVLLDGHQPPGRHELRWDARDSAGRPVARGAYFYRLETDRGVQEKKLIVLR